MALYDHIWPVISIHNFYMALYDHLWDNMAIYGITKYFFLKKLIM